MNNRVTAIVAPIVGDIGAMAQSALTKLQNAERPSSEELDALRMVLVEQRPALRVRNGTIEDLSPEAAASFVGWDGFLDSATGLLGSVGLIGRSSVAGEPDASETSGVGTGFLVGPSVVATNKHVAASLTSGLPLAEDASRIVFNGQSLEGSDGVAGVPVSIHEIIAEHPDADVALLRIDAHRSLASRRPLKVSSDVPGDEVPVACIGFPFPDTRNPLFAETLFGGEYGIQRVSPGHVVNPTDTVLTHDCTTLGGSSGSPLISFNGEVVGIHFDGSYLSRNLAVVAPVLAEFMAEHVA
jgi:S1-C subfamily serine protease